MMTNRPAAHAIADPAAGLILAAVDIAAVPERVFRALTVEEEITQWWGSPEAYKTEVWVADLRAGGLWKARGHDANGNSFTVSGAILELDPPHNLMQTWKADWDGDRQTQVTYRLRSQGDLTRLTVRHEGFAGRPESCEMYAHGWEMTLNWLHGHFTQVASGGGDRFYFCRLVPPRASFADDMTAEEVAIMNEHGAYWRHNLQRGVAIVFGPVADPKGVWGLGVIRAADTDAARAFEAGDPAIRADIGFRYDTLPMIRAVVST